jgi:UDP-glucose 4-epimerase
MVDRNSEKHILVVGGAGYIGSHTALHLNEAGYRTVVFDNLVSGHEGAVLLGDFARGDLAVVSDIEAVFASYDIACVMHFAAYSYVGESVHSPQKYYRNNVTGTLNLLDVMLRHNVMDIVFSSTCATYPGALS